MDVSLSNLQNRIEEFLAAMGMSPTVFGRKVLKDPNFVFDLRNGARSPSIRTAEKIYAFIEAQQKLAKKPQRRGAAGLLVSQETRTFTDAREKALHDIDILIGGHGVLSALSEIVVMLLPAYGYE
jgi:hypothetical protein